MDRDAARVDNTFDKVVAELDRYSKVFRKGGMLENTVDQMGGDIAWFNDIRDKLDELIDTINDAHMYAMVNYADTHGESVNNEGNLRNPAARAVTEPTGDDDKYPPVVMPKLKKPATTEAVGDFAEPYYDLIDRVGGDAKLVNNEALAWMGGGQRQEMAKAHYNGIDPSEWEDTMSDDDIADTITRWFSADDIKEFVDHFERHYDLNVETEESQDLAALRKLAGL